jgi:hypothetical protein
MRAVHVVQDGTTDKLFHSLYEPIISRIVEVYDPGAIVLQCGADSLAADRLGNFSMTIAGTQLPASVFCAVESLAAASTQKTRSRRHHLLGCIARIWRPFHGSSAQKLPQRLVESIWWEVTAAAAAAGALWADRSAGYRGGEAELERELCKAATACAGHTHCVKHTMKFGIPLLVTGGGGYTKCNVARCWTNETAALVRQQISSKLPPSAYNEYFLKDSDPTLRLNYKGEKTCDDMNRQDDIHRIFSKVMHNLEAVRTMPTPQAKVSALWFVPSILPMVAAHEPFNAANRGRLDDTEHTLLAKHSCRAVWHPAMLQVSWLSDQQSSSETSTGLFHSPGNDMHKAHVQKHVMNLFEWPCVWYRQGKLRASWNRNTRHWMITWLSVSVFLQDIIKEEVIGKMDAQHHRPLYLLLLCGRTL